VWRCEKKEGAEEQKEMETTTTRERSGECGSTLFALCLIFIHIFYTLWGPAERSLSSESGAFTHHSGPPSPTH